ncbi:MAG: hypothetical protein ACH346_06315 [Chthoniobacterales bacterium]
MASSKVSSFFLSYQAVFSYYNSEFPDIELSDPRINLAVQDVRTRKIERAISMTQVARELTRKNAHDAKEMRSQFRNSFASILLNVSAQKTTKRMERKATYALQDAITHIQNSFDGFKAIRDELKDINDEPLSKGKSTWINRYQGAGNMLITNKKVGLPQKGKNGKSSASNLFEYIKYRSDFSPQFQMNFFPTLWKAEEKSAVLNPGKISQKVIAKEKRKNQPVPATSKKEKLTKAQKKLQRRLLKISLQNQPQSTKNSPAENVASSRIAQQNKNLVRK